MPLSAPYLFAAAMDVTPDREALFNEVYDREHVPRLRAVRGVLSVARFRARDFRMSLGGEVRTVSVGAEPRYVALYELERPDVLVSPAWAEAVEAGRWPTDVRPHTRNRHHVLLERLA
jgi:hypothetical protein